MTRPDDARLFCFIHGVVEDTPVDAKPLLFALYKDRKEEEGWLFLKNF